VLPLAKNFKNVEYLLVHGTADGNGASLLLYSYWLFLIHIKLASNTMHIMLMVNVDFSLIRPA
jgi:flagellar biosynthesis protein FliR